MSKTNIGVLGGSGLYEFLSDIKEIKVDTPYGSPSDKIAIGSYKGKKVAFLPRHGKTHSLPPHAINYRANLWAFKELGVKFILSPNAAGSLQPSIKPGEFVVADQFIDRTKNRKDTFYDGPITTHIHCGEPYCPYLRKLIINATKDIGIPLHETGTVVVIQGPRFSTKSESKWFTKMGWEVINMTQYPEVVLAKELEISFANISLVTDFDCGLEQPPVSVENMIATFKQNISQVKETIKLVIENIDIHKKTSAHTALSVARFND